MPTGGGKIVIFSELRKRYIEKIEKKVVVLTHRTELSKQTAMTLKKSGVHNKLINTSVKALPLNNGYNCYVAMVETLKNRLKDRKFSTDDVGLVIIDEAHNNSFQKLLGNFKNAFIIGVTATPLSSDITLPMNKNYNELIIGETITSLINQGFLAKPKTWRYDVEMNNQAATQIQEIIKNMELSGKTTLSLTIGIITLIIGATTVFGEIQDSINMIWNVKAKPKKGWLKLIKDRLLSGSIIIGLGFLLIVSLIINGALTSFDTMLRNWLPETSIIIFTILSIGVNFIVLTVLFGVIYKVLPDAKIQWKDVRAGALFTSFLFLAGRYIIGFYIGTAGVGSPYGAAGSIVVILIWVYYSAAILYFSVEFTKAYTAFKGEKIQPAEYAIYVEQKETEKENANVIQEDK